MNSFDDFLHHCLSQKEASLLIAKDEAELVEMARMLESRGFEHVHDSFTLLDKIQSSTKAFFVIHHKISKNIYEFIAQYPTGQIQLYDPDTMKSQIQVPNYEGSSIIFLITKENLIQIQLEGFDILSRIGMAYQT